MRKSGVNALLRSDGATGVLLVLGVLVLEAITGFFGSMENRFYDQASLLTGRLASEQVVVLAIDDQSIANIGRWPWPRDVHAKMIDLLTQGNAKTIAQTTLFFEPQVDRGLVHLAEIKEMLSHAQTSDPVIPRVASVVDAAIVALDTDAALAQSIQRSGRVCCPWCLIWVSPWADPISLCLILC
jgi:serine/threonine-protein kinase